MKKILKKNKCFDCGRSYVVPVKEAKELKNQRCFKCNREADSLLLKKKKTMVNYNHNERGTWVIRNIKTKEIVEEFRVQGTCFVAFRKIPLYERNKFEMVKVKHPKDKFKKLVDYPVKKGKKK